MKKIIGTLILAILLTFLFITKQATKPRNADAGLILRTVGTDGPAAPVFVQCQQGTQSWGTTIVVSISPTAGNLLFYAVSYAAGDVPTGDVTANGSPPQDFTEIDDVDGTNVELWTGYIADANADITSVTLTWGADGYGVGFVCEVANVDTLDDNDTNSGGGNGIPVGPESLNTVNDAIFISFYGSANTSSYTEGQNQSGSTPATWTLPANGSYPNNPDIDGGGGVVYLIVSSQSTRDHVWSTSEENTWNTSNNVFKD